jgi:MOSC domain-containing protein YiiM
MVPKLKMQGFDFVTIKQIIRMSLGEERTLQRKDHVEQTGIFKFPTDQPVQVTKLGLAGDVIISKKHHGGPDQVVYIYRMADYVSWTNEVGRVLAPGTFGDNLTISELESAQFNIGDYLHIGEVTLQFTARMEDPQWVRKFHHAERPGLYCRVSKEGVVSAGDVVSIEKYKDGTISILQVFRDHYDKNRSARNGSSI